MTKLVTYETGQPVRLRGVQLQALKIDLDQRPGSVIIEYRAVRGKQGEGVAGKATCRRPVDPGE